MLGLEKDNGRWSRHFLDQGHAEERESAASPSINLSEPPGADCAARRILSEPYQMRIQHGMH